MTSIYKQKFEAIGTHWDIEFEFDPAQTDAEKMMSRVHDRIAQFDKDYSRFREDSLVNEIARNPGTYRMPDDAEPLMSLYENLYSLTDGAFTPLIGSAMVESGYDAHYSLVPKEMHAVALMDETIAFNAPYLTARQPVLIDIGAAGKGYLVDIVAKTLSEGGASSLTIDAGGDIAVLSKENSTTRIGLEHPGDASQAIGVATIANQSLCGSSGNRRAWDRFHHIINPRTLSSPRHVAATWVVAQTTMLADALATCLYFVPAARLAQHRFEYLIVNADYSIEHSDAFPAELFTNSIEPAYESA